MPFRSQSTAAGEVAAALKEYAKALPGSNYVRLEDVEAGVKGPEPGVTA